MDLSDDEKIKIHLENVEKFKTEQHKNVLSLQDLKELNLNIGLSELEWSELMDKAAHHLTLAKNHLKGNNYTDAFNNADKALALNPFLRDGKTTKAKAALHLWLLDDNEDYRKEAEALAKSVLNDNSSDREALAILQQLRSSNRAIQKNKKWSVKTKWLILPIAIFILFIAGFATNVSSDLIGSEPHQTEQVYNQLSVLEEKVQSVLADLKNAYSRKNNLIEEIISLHSTIPMQLSDQLTTLKQKQRSTDNITDWYEYQLQIDDVLKEIKSISNKQLSDDNITLLWVQIEGAENRITFSKRKYNDAVQQYNIYAKQHSTSDHTITILNYLND